MGVVGLFRGGDRPRRAQLARHPEGLEIGHRPAAAEVAEVASQPNMRAISATASFSMAELARPPSRHGIRVQDMASA